MMRFAVPTLVCLLIAPGLLAAQPEDPQRLLERAVKLHQAGDFAAAIEQYRAFLEIVPGRAEVRSNLGAAYARLGRYEEAIDQYRRALELDSENLAIRFNLGVANYRTARLGEAVAELTQVVAAQPANKNAITLLADCHLQMGENRRVVELLSPLEGEFANDRAFAYLLGTALIRDKQVEKGQVLVDRILRDGDSAEARLMLGTAYMVANDYGGALKELEQAVKLNPRLPGVHSFYARALMATGNRDLAMQSFRAQIELDPNDFQSNFYLGVLLKQEQRYNEGLAHLQRALQLRPGALEVLYQIGALYVATGKTADAQLLLEKVVEQAPEFVEAHVSLATVYYRLKRKADGDRHRAIVDRLNAGLQARAPGAKDELGPAYRGDGLPGAPKPSNPEIKKPNWPPPG